MWRACVSGSQWVRENSTKLRFSRRLGVTVSVSKGTLEAGCRVERAGPREMGMAFAIDWDRPVKQE